MRRDGQNPNCHPVRLAAGPCRGGFLAPNRRVRRQRPREMSFEANRSWSVRVRRHTEGRRLVYGSYTSNFAGARDLHTGSVLKADASDIELLTLIREVTSDVGGAVELATDINAELPAEDIW